MQDVQEGGEGHSRKEVAQPTQTRRRRFISSSTDETIDGEVSEDLYDEVQVRGRSIRRSLQGEREGSPSPGGRGRSRRIETGRLSLRRVRERPREEVLDLEE